MTSLDTKSIASHLLVALSHAQAERRAVGVDQIASTIGVRKADVRTLVSRLHAEGHVDGARLRLTMSGLALATALAGSKLRAPRRQELRLRRVA